MLKLLDILQEILQEVTYPYREADISWDEEDGTLLAVSYTFKTPKHQYRVMFNSTEYKPEDKTFELSFGLDKGSFNGMDTSQMTGEGTAKMILKTVEAIIEEFLHYYESEGVKYLVVNPTSEKRRKIYNLLFPQLPQHITSKIKINETLRGSSRK